MKIFNISYRRYDDETVCDYHFRGHISLMAHCLTVNMTVVGSIPTQGIVLFSFRCYGKS